jgi:hypothetical protein
MVKFAVVSDAPGTGKSVFVGYVRWIKIKNKKRWCSRLSWNAGHGKAFWSLEGGGMARLEAAIATGAMLPPFVGSVLLYRASLTGSTPARATKLDRARPTALTRKLVRPSAVGRWGGIQVNTSHEHQAHLLSILQELVVFSTTMLSIRCTGARQPPQ